MLSFFNSKPIIAPDVSEEILIAYSQMFERFGREVFLQQTELILPNDKFFPASAGSLAELAKNSFTQVKRHAKLEHWPIDLNLGSPLAAPTLPRLSFNQDYYGDNCQISTDFSQNNRISITSSSSDFSNPQTAISHMIMQLSAVMLTYTEQTEQRQLDLPRIELMASFLGFGVMLANTTYQFRGGCGSCYKPSANRQHGLSEEEMIYALAVFCLLKEIPSSQVLPYLKGYLRSVFKKSIKQLKANTQYEALASQVHGAD